MTIAVDLGRKATKQNETAISKFCRFSLLFFFERSTCFIMQNTFLYKNNALYLLKKAPQNTVNSEIFSRFLFSQVALTVIIATLKIRD